MNRPRSGDPAAMQNEFLPEETPQSRTPAPMAAGTESVAATETTAKNTRLDTEHSAHLRRLKQRYRRRNALTALGLLTFVLAIPIAFWFFLWWLPDATPSVRNGFLFIAAIMLSPIVNMINRRKPLLQENDMVRVGGIEAVGSLLEMLDIAVDSKDIEALHPMLISRLIKMKSSDITYLTSRQRKILLNHLWSNADLHGTNPTWPNFCLAALKALEQIGVASDIATVEKIAGMNAETPNRVRIRDAAVECLPLLKIRAGMVAESKTLLRASAPEKAGGDTLLRPASGPNDARPKELLRPSDGGSADETTG